MNDLQSDADFFFSKLDQETFFYMIFCFDRVRYKFNREEKKSLKRGHKINNFRDQDQ
jgi:hypothetical protein